jgi:D-glycerate 3-kinase
MEREALPAEFARQIEHLWGPLADWISGQRNALARPLVVGLCGPQGSGKSTGAEALGLLFKTSGVRAAVLGLDDLYLPKAERSALAKTVHPLFATRGPPGTHDIALGHAVLDRLAQPGPVRLPRFDKAVDDRAPARAWPTLEGPVDVVVFEGWCVGARAETQTELGPPLNTLEAEADPDGRWRAAVNAALAGAYRGLFERIDRLIYLQAPSFEVVGAWRLEQEVKLRTRTGRGMSDAELARFLMHYERISRKMDREAPDHADVLVRLAADRTPTSVVFRRP